MMILHSADLKTLNMNLPELLRKRGALLTAGNQSGCNTMTIGWAQSGMVWGKPVCTVYVRPERYTYQFMEAQDYFTLSFLPESEKQTMAFCGSRSGRDTDKIAACGLAVEYGAGDAPYFAQAELVLVCRKISAMFLPSHRRWGVPAFFIDLRRAASVSSSSISAGV